MSVSILYKLKINKELDKAEIVSKLEFKTDSNNHYYDTLYLARSILIGQYLFYFYEKDTLVKINNVELEVLESIKIEDKSEYDKTDFGFLSNR